MSDKISPSHYKLPNGLQAIDITRHFDFVTGNVLKYVIRAGNKEGESRLDDLSKARWYLDLLIEDAIESGDENITDPADIPNFWGKS